MTTYLPDFYPPNFNDGPVPWDKVFADKRIGGAILKLSEGTSYDVGWAIREGSKVHDHKKILGLYHFLRWDLDGATQWRYYWANAKSMLLAGDLIPIVDYEHASSSHPNSSTPTATAKKNLLGFIKAGHADGQEVMVYGHADVVAHFGSWKKTGADAWWAPGSQPYAGACLWQYGPYVAPVGYPTDPAGIGRSDMSRALTSLPLIHPVTPPSTFVYDLTLGKEKPREFKRLRVARKHERVALRAHAQDGGYKTSIEVRKVKSG